MRYPVFHCRIRYEWCIILLRRMQVYQSFWSAVTSTSTGNVSTYQMFRIQCHEELVLLNPTNSDVSFPDSWKYIMQNNVDTSVMNQIITAILFENNMQSWHICMEQLNFTESIDIFLWSQYSMLYCAAVRSLKWRSHLYPRIRDTCFCPDELVWAISLADSFSSDA